MKDREAPDQEPLTTGHSKRLQPPSKRKRATTEEVLGQAQSRQWYEQGVASNLPPSKRFRVEDPSMDHPYKEPVAQSSSNRGATILCATASDCGAPFCGASTVPIPSSNDLYPELEPHKLTEILVDDIRESSSGSNGREAAVRIGDSWGNINRCTKEGVVKKVICPLYSEVRKAGGELCTYQRVTLACSVSPFHQTSHERHGSALQAKGQVTVGHTNHVVVKKADIAQIQQILAPKAPLQSYPQEHLFRPSDRPHDELLSLPSETSTTPEQPTEVNDNHGKSVKAQHGRVQEQHQDSLTFSKNVVGTECTDSARRANHLAKKRATQPPKSKRLMKQQRIRDSEKRSAAASKGWETRKVRVNLDDAVSASSVTHEKSCKSNGAIKAAIIPHVKAGSAGITNGRSEKTTYATKVKQMTQSVQASKSIIVASTTLEEKDERLQDMKRNAIINDATTENGNRIQVKKKIAKTIVGKVINPALAIASDLPLSEESPDVVRAECASVLNNCITFVQDLVHKAPFNDQITSLGPPSIGVKNLMGGEATQTSTNDSFRKIMRTTKACANIAIKMNTNKLASIDTQRTTQPDKETPKEVQTYNNISIGKASSASVSLVLPRTMSISHVPRHTASTSRLATSLLLDPSSTPSAPQRSSNFISLPKSTKQVPCSGLQTSPTSPKKALFSAVVRPSPPVSRPASTNGPPPASLLHTPDSSPPPSPPRTPTPLSDCYNYIEKERTVVDVCEHAQCVNMACLNPQKDGPTVVTMGSVPQGSRITNHRIGVNGSAFGSENAFGQTMYNAVHPSRNEHRKKWTPSASLPAKSLPGQATGLVPSSMMVNSLCPSHQCDHSYRFDHQGSFRLDSRMNESCRHDYNEMMVGLARAVLYYHELASSSVSSTSSSNIPPVASSSGEALSMAPRSTPNPATRRIYPSPPLTTSSFSRVLGQHNVRDMTNMRARNRTLSARRRSAPPNLSHEKRLAACAMSPTLSPPQRLFSYPMPANRSVPVSATTRCRVSGAATSMAKHVLPPHAALAVPAVSTKVSEYRGVKGKYAAATTKQARKVLKSSSKQYVVTLGPGPLGVTLDMSSSLNTKSVANDLVVERVVLGSVADKAGIRAGDIVRAVRERKDSVADFLELYSTSPSANVAQASGVYTIWRNASEFASIVARLRRPLQLLLDRHSSFGSSTTAVIQHDIASMLSNENNEPPIYLSRNVEEATAQRRHNTNCAHRPLRRHIPTSFSGIGSMRSTQGSVIHSNRREMFNNANMKYKKTNALLPFKTTTVEKSGTGRSNDERSEKSIRTDESTISTNGTPPSTYYRRRAPPSIERGSGSSSSGSSSSSDGGGDESSIISNTSSLVTTTSEAFARVDRAIARAAKHLATQARRTKTSTYTTEKFRDNANCGNIAYNIFEQTRAPTCTATPTSVLPTPDHGPQQITCIALRLHCEGSYWEVQVAPNTSIWNLLVQACLIVGTGQPKNYFLCRIIGNSRIALKNHNTVGEHEFQSGEMLDLVARKCVQPEK